MPPPRKCVAFTLAEVLITLGIIGVVAALTIPTIIQNHKKHIVETKLEKFYSTINQAIRMSEIDNGDKMYWEVTDIDDFYHTYLEKYLPGVKYKFVNWRVPRGHLEFPDGSKAIYDLYLLDDSKVGGHFIYCINAQDCGYQDFTLFYGTKHFSFGFWPNTITTRSNIAGLMKYHQGKGVEPYAANWNGTEIQLKDGQFGCKKDNVKYAYYCTAIIQRNGWKIPKDYPLKL